MERVKSIRKKRKSRIQSSINKSDIKEAVLECYQEIQLQQDTKHIPTELVKINLNLIFYILKFILAFLGIAFLITFFRVLNEGIKFNNIISSLVALYVAALSFVFAFICHKTGKAIEQETDKNYIVSYFSAMVSFVALIVALIALLK